MAKYLAQIHSLKVGELSLNLDLSCCKANSSKNNLILKKKVHLEGFLANSTLIAYVWILFLGKAAANFSEFFVFLLLEEK